MPKIYVSDGRYNSGLKHTILHEEEVLTTKAKILFSLIEHWGMVAARHNGEDSSGRSKIALLTPDEVVDRAAECVAAAWSHCVGAGWIINAPSLDELKEESDDV